ncbi:MAG: class I SAM-dependent methyltransferase [Caldilineaceae bacterium]
MTTQADSNRWTNYYQARAGRPPRPLLLNALKRFADRSATTPYQAIDLGCGEGTDTVAMLERGWQVLAIDQQAEAIVRLQGQTPLNCQPRLHTQVAAFEDLTLPSADLIYAGYSLPFCRPTHFTALWEQIVGALRSGGRFAGQIFGNRDDWAGNPHMTFHTATAARQLFSDFTFEHFSEIDEDGRAVSGPKHWHYFDVIACKK